MNTQVLCVWHDIVMYLATSLVPQMLLLGLYSSFCSENHAQLGVLSFVIDGFQDTENFHLQSTGIPSLFYRKSPPLQSL